MTQVSLNCKNCEAAVELCLGLLFCMKHTPLRNDLCTNGMSVLSRISMNKVLSIIPSQIQIPVAPFKLSRCFGLQYKVKNNSTIQSTTI